MFSELIQEANIWAEVGSADSPSRRVRAENGRRIENKDDTNIDACLEQLARAISAHVTDILIERLGLEERLANTHESSTSKQFTRESNSPADGKLGNDPVRLRPSRSRSCTPRSLPQSPSPSRPSRLPRRVVDHGPRCAQPFERRCSRARGDDVMVRYHSENRLNRIEPPPDINETPLENRASRLRRAIAGKKLATRDKSHQ